MDGLVSGVTTLTSQPQLSQIQKRVQSLCGWERLVKLLLFFSPTIYNTCFVLCIPRNISGVNVRFMPSVL